MNGLIEAAIFRSRAMLTLLALIIVFGLIAFIQIPKEANPDIQIPILIVNLELRGVSPEDAERLLVRPMEEVLRNVDGIKEMTSSAFQGGGHVVVEFQAGFDVKKALADVRAKVEEAKAELPTEAEEPTVQEVNFSLFPVITVVLSGEVPERTLIYLARQLRDDIQKIPQVLKVDIAGQRDEQVEMIVHPSKFEGYQLGFEALSRIDNNNVLIGAGSLQSERGKFEVIVPGLIETAKDLLDMPLVVDGDAVVRVKDVAEIRPTFKDPTGFARLNGNKAIALEVVKRTGENIIDTIEQVKITVAETTGSWPKNVYVTLTDDQSVFIKQMLDDLANNMITAIILVMIVIVASLGIRSSLIVGVALPGSFLFGILILAMMGLSINVVVLFALILASGMLVDGAIVMVEYADRKLHEGLPPLKAYAVAAREMAAPITSSIATTLAAFFPLLFWQGITGEFMKFLPLTLIPTMGGSLLMALIFIPVLGAQFSRHPKRSEFHDQKPVDQIDIHDLEHDKGIGFYVRALEWSLKRPAKVLGWAFASMILVQIAYGVFGKGVEFFPNVEPDFTVIKIHGRGNLSVFEQDEWVRDIEKQILAYNNEHHEFEAVYTRTGPQTGGENPSEDQIGAIRINFEDWRIRRKADDILSDLLSQLKTIPGIRVSIENQRAGPPVGKPIQVLVSGTSQEKIDQTVQNIRQEMARLGGFVDVEDNRSLPGIEWKLDVDRAEASKFNVDIGEVGSIVQLVTNGLLFSKYRPDNSDDEVDIVARFPEEFRTIRQLDAIKVPTENGNIPVSHFTKRLAEPKVTTLHRQDGRRTITVQSEVATGELPDTKLQQLKNWLGQQKFDPDIKISFQGQDEEQKKSAAFLQVAFLVAVGLMGFILVAQFNSFFETLLILSAVLLSTAGVFLGLLITGQPFGIVMCGIGIISLAGIVVSNNIILINTYNHLKDRFHDPVRAIVVTCSQRFRPVFLTVITTVLGVIPLMFKVNIDFWSRKIEVGAPSTQFWVQISTCIGFGLTFATVLTLIVTPCSLLLKERRARRKLASATVSSPA